ncbi:MAG: SOSS complex subunit B family protein [Candidatus Woesearchaeota archaeon]
MEVKDLQARQGKVDITVDVVDVSQPREFDKFGKVGKVASATVKDSSGSIQMTLWNEEIDKVKQGSKIHIENGYVNEYKGELQLTAGRFGKIEVVQESSHKGSEAELTEDEKEEADILSDLHKHEEPEEDIDIEEEDVK